MVTTATPKLLEDFYVNLFKQERLGGSYSLGYALSSLDQESFLKGDTYGDVSFLAFLAMSEEDPKCLLRAMASRMLRGDTEGFRSALQLALIRRDAGALHFASTSFLASDEDQAQIGACVPWVPNPRPLPATMADLDTFAFSVGATRLQILAHPNSSGDKYTRPVAVVTYPSGDLGVIKQVMCEPDGPLGRVDLEPEILNHLVDTGYPFLDPSFKVGTQGPYTFLQRPFLYGSVLSQTVWEGCGKARAREIVARVAVQLMELHQRGVLLLDLSPENLMADGTLFDFGHSRILPSGESSVPTFVMNPMFTSPEVALGKAGRESDVFALGVLYHKLISHTSPFPNGPFSFGPGIAHILPNMVLPYAGEPGEDFDLIRSMLEKDPGKRPTAGEVLSSIQSMALVGDPEVLQKRPVFRSSNTAPINPGTPVALVPMRCGVPHKGHINLICRLMDLGYFVQVSLQMAYTWTDADPLPKWLVSRMIQAAVKERGYPLADLDIVLTPFEVRSSLHMHFLMLPTWEDVQVVVSGNPEVESLLGPILGDRPFIRAQNICGDLTDANGTRLRTAMLSGDHQTVEAMLPQAIRDEWPDLLSLFPKETDAQAREPVDVFLQVEDLKGVPFRTLRVRRYEHPEKALRRLFLGSQVDVWSFGRKVALRGSLIKNTEFTYVGQAFDFEKGDLTIRYATDLLIG